MNTHIIIPIKDIKEQMAVLKKQIEILKNNPTNLADAQGKYIFLGELLSIYKQISLNKEEKNYMPIAKECAVMNNYDENDDVFLHGVIVGYKQALKELL